MSNSLSTLAELDAQKNWEHARRDHVFEEVVCALKRCSTDLLSFTEVKDRLRLTHKLYRGVQTIPIDRIRGSVGRYHDFTSTFLPRREFMRNRWQRVAAVSFDKGMPPIEVFQVGEAYFVQDGNHRVSVARQHKMDRIQAHVWEYKGAVGLSADADHDELLIKADYVEFLEATQLDVLRPAQNITFTAPGHYRELEFQITLHQQQLEAKTGATVPLKEAVTSWYDTIYQPTIDSIKESKLLEFFPDRTADDLNIWVWHYNEELRDCIPCLEEALAQMEQEMNPTLLRRLSQSFAHLFNLKD